jgi:DnaK suppressor protein
MSAKLAGDELELRNLLVEQKRMLWNELRSELFEQTGAELHNQYDVPQDIGEQSILDLLSDAGLAVADIRHSQLTQLEEAERRLEMGSYGVCESCGETIELKRLKLLPFTAFCVNCQREQEGPAKPPGTKI